MNFKILAAIIVSFCIYAFPIPTLHGVFLWGGILSTTLSNMHLITPVGKLLITIFAIVFQSFSVFCFHQLFKLKPGKILLFSLPLILLLFFALVIGQYMVSFLVFLIEQMLGISPV